MTKKLFQHIINLFLFLIFLTGCAAPAQFKAELNKIAEEDRIENQHIFLSMGERTFDVDKITLIKAFITTFTNKNIAVVNVDKEIGYLMAEGSGFLSPQKDKEVGMENVERLNERTGKYGFRWEYTLGNDTQRFTVNLFDKGKNRTTAKVGISNQIIGAQQIKIHELPSMMLSAFYKELWRELEKSLFIQRETQ